MYCSQCGAECPDTAKFCANCGQPLQGASTQKTEKPKTESSEVYMDLPTKHLCSEDCKGMCEKCGKNLNEGDCSCENIDIDPRWSTLLDIMNNSEN